MACVLSVARVLGIAMSEMVRPEMTHVYGLYANLSNKPFYVGITAHPKRRLWAHRAAADGKRQDSLTGCGFKGKDIEMRLLAECDERHNAELIERCLIEHYKIIVINKKQLFKSALSGGQTSTP